MDTITENMHRLLMFTCLLTVPKNTDILLHHLIVMNLFSLTQIDLLLMSIT